MQRQILKKYPSLPKPKINSLQNEVITLSDAVKKYEEEIEKISEKRAENLVNDAVSSGKFFRRRKIF